MAMRPHVWSVFSSTRLGSELHMVMDYSDEEYVPIKKRRLLEEQRRMQRMGKVIWDKPLEFK